MLLLCCSFTGKQPFCFPHRGTKDCTYEKVLTLVARGAVHLDYSRPLDDEAVLSADAVPPSGAIPLPENAP
jgi:hypothetical protein